MFFEMIYLCSIVALTFAIVSIDNVFNRFSLRAFFVALIVFVTLHICWWQTIIFSEPSIKFNFLYAALLVMFYSGLFWRLAPISTLMIFVGVASNKLAIVSNSGTMPVFVSPESSLYSFAKQSSRHHIASGQTHFAFLCDWIYINEKTTQSIISIGDLFIVFSSFVITFEILRYMRRKEKKDIS